MNRQQVAYRRQNALYRRMQTIKGSPFVREGVGLMADNRLAKTNMDTKTIMPEVAATTTAKVPVNVPNGAPLELYTGMQPDDVITITIDLLSMPASTTPETIVLFDKGGYHRQKVGYTNPSDVIYVGSPTRNTYLPTLDDMCAEAVHNDMLLMEVHNCNTSELPNSCIFANPIEIYRHRNYRGSDERIFPAHYPEPQNFRDNMRRITLSDKNSRIDRHTAWVLQVYPGTRLDLHFWLAAVTRD